MKDLFPHNQKAYHAVIEHFRDRHSRAINIRFLSIQSK